MFKGTNLLLLCSTETSANSYYGDSTLHQMSTNGESQTVQLSKNLRIIFLLILILIKLH